MDYIIRFLIGSLVVCVFSLVGDVLCPKSFAGLFSAAPSVALATLPLALSRGGEYVAIEGRSMIIGAVALAGYSFLVCQLAQRRSQLPDLYWHGLLSLLGLSKFCWASQCLYA
jgi:hypothetical protein